MQKPVHLLPSNKNYGVLESFYVSPKIKYIQQKDYLVGDPARLPAPGSWEPFFIYFLPASAPSKKARLQLLGAVLKKNIYQLLFRLPLKRPALQRCLVQNLLKTTLTLFFSPSWTMDIGHGALYTVQFLSIKIVYWIIYEYDISCRSFYLSFYLTIYLYLTINL